MSNFIHTTLENIRIFFYITRYNQGNVMSGPDSILVNPTLKCKRFNYTERWQGKITFWRTKKASDPLHTC